MRPFRATPTLLFPICRAGNPTCCQTVPTNIGLGMYAASAAVPGIGQGSPRGLYRATSNYARATASEMIGRWATRTLNLIMCVPNVSWGLRATARMITVLRAVHRTPCYRCQCLFPTGLSRDDWRYTEFKSRSGRLPETAVPTMAVPPAAAVTVAHQSARPGRNIPRTFTSGKRAGPAPNLRRMRSRIGWKLAQTAVSRRYITRPRAGAVIVSRADASCLRRSL